MQKKLKTERCCFFAFAGSQSRRCDDWYTSIDIYCFYTIWYKSCIALHVIYHHVISIIVYIIIFIYIYIYIYITYILYMENMIIIYTHSRFCGPSEPPGPIENQKNQTSSDHPENVINPLNPSLWGNSNGMSRSSIPSPMKVLKPQGVSKIEIDSGCTDFFWYLPNSAF